MASKGFRGKNIYKVLRNNGFISNRKYFGIQSKTNKANNRRNIVGGIEAAIAFFNSFDQFKIGTDELYNKHNMLVAIRHLSDGTIITFKSSSYSDQTPTIEFSKGFSFKTQKIHFV